MRKHNTTRFTVATTPEVHARLIELAQTLRPRTSVAALAGSILEDMVPAVAQPSTASPREPRATDPHVLPAQSAAREVQA